MSMEEIYILKINNDQGKYDSGGDHHSRSASLAYIFTRF